MKNKWNYDWIDKSEINKIAKKVLPEIWEKRFISDHKKEICYGKWFIGINGKVDRIINGVIQENSGYIESVCENAIIERVNITGKIKEIYGGIIKDSFGKIEKVAFDGIIYNVYDGIIDLVCGDGVIKNIFYGVIKEVSGGIVQNVNKNAIVGKVHYDGIALLENKNIMRMQNKIIKLW